MADIKGPWTTEDRHHVHAVMDNQGKELFFVERSPYMVHGVNCGSITTHGRTVEDLAAIARVAAAAPALLAALQAVLAWADKECMPQGGKNDGPWEAAEAAIAQAQAEGTDA